MSYLTRMMVLLGLLVAAAPPCFELGAQVASASKASTVTLVSKSDLPRGAKVVIERRAKLTPRDVILVDLDRATPRDLAGAFLTLEAIDRRVGDDPRADLRVTPKSYTPPPGFGTSRFGTRMKMNLIRLITAKETTVAGIGRARAVAIEVGPRRTRPSANASR